MRPTQTPSAMSPTHASPNALMQRARRLAPGSFALVMATGIVSIDASQHGLPWLARALFALNLLAFVCLIALSVLRLVWFRDEFMTDLRSPVRSAGFLTFVAGACMLGSQSLLLQDWIVLAWLLFACALPAWLLLGGFWLVALARAMRDGSLTRHIQGGWLIAVVATQGLSVLLVLLALRETALVGLWLPAFALFVLGIALYQPIIALILWRLSCLPLRPRELTPPYWITMGALAISTLAGSLLLRHLPPLPPRVALLLPHIIQAVWLAASVWLLAMIVLWTWRCSRTPIRYSVEDWDIVFPLGMYTVGTYEFAQALPWPALLEIPRIGVYVSLIAWTLVAVGALRRGLRIARIARRRVH